MAAKSNKATMQERVDHIYEMLVDGYSRREILQYAAKIWVLSTRQTDLLIARANAILEAESKQLKPIHLSKGVRRLEKQYRKADKADAIRAAIAAQAELNKLLRLYESPNESNEDDDSIDNLVNNLTGSVTDTFADVAEDEADECEEE